jgi:crotonobetainyl-CoA:carnitine CoA-transferase CaiB-like acyl-CoA transferase
MLLADLGADVVKVEPPPIGDPLRTLDRETFAGVNRNKRSILLDVTQPADKATLLRLVAGYDAVVESYRPGTLSALGLGYECLRTTNPRVVLCSISGYGQTGPYAHRPGHDVNVLALSGFFAARNRPDGATDRVGVRVGDLTGAMYAALSLVVALGDATSSGSGRHLDVSLHEAAVAWAGPLILPALNRPDVAERLVNGDNDVFGTRDGRRLSFATFEDKFWLRFRTALCDEFPELNSSEYDSRADRTRRQREVHALLTRTFAARDLAWWTVALRDVDIPWAPVYDRPRDLVDDEHVCARQLIYEVPGFEPGESYRQVRFPVLFGDGAAIIRRPAPALGEHTDEVLASIDETGHYR